MKKKTENLTLKDLIKELKLTRANVPKPSTIISWLSHTEFSADEKQLNTIYTKEQYKNCKKLIEQTIKQKQKEKHEKAKADKIYLHISIGGTKELENMFKIDIADHLMTRVISPKGCDKYCTENQIGSARNWIRLPAILLTNGNDIDKIFNILSNEVSVTKRQTGIYEYTGLAFIKYIKSLHAKCYNLSASNWFKDKYNV